MKIYAAATTHQSDGGISWAFVQIESILFLHHFAVNVHKLLSNL